MQDCKNLSKTSKNNNRSFTCEQCGSCVQQDPAQTQQIQKEEGRERLVFLTAAQQACLFCFGIFRAIFLKLLPELSLFVSAESSVHGLNLFCALFVALSHNMRLLKLRLFLFFFSSNLLPDGEDVGQESLQIQIRGRLGSEEILQQEGKPRRREKSREKILVTLLVNCERKNTNDIKRPGG